MQLPTAQMSFTQTHGGGPLGDPVVPPDDPDVPVVPALVEPWVPPVLVPALVLDVPALAAELVALPLVDPPDAFAPPSTR